MISKKINQKKLLQNKEIKKNIKILSKYKNFLLVIIDNEIKKENNTSDITLRYYGIGAQIIKDFKVKNMILLSKKKEYYRIRGFGLKIKKQVIIK